MAGLGKTMENLSLDCLYPSQGENLAPLKCKLEVLPLDQTRLLKIFNNNFTI
jgi:hypothetical protein